MKRLLTALCALALMASSFGALAEGEGLRGYDRNAGYVYVTFGSYPQTKEGEVRPILWRVLTVDAEKAYLCSEYILFARELHSSLTEYKKIGSDFGKTELCAYLNGEFAAQAFDPEELDMLLPCETFGKVFLLDGADLKNRDIGMGENTRIKQSAGLRAWGTEWAVENGLFVYLKKYGSHSPYWIRNQSTTDRRHGRCTKANGVLGHIESGRDNEGVRPAVYLKADGYEIAGGTGTMEDPYMIRPRTEKEEE